MSSPGSKPEFSNLPVELLSQVISHLFPPWSLLVLDRAQPRSQFPLSAAQPISGLPTATPALLLTCHALHNLAIHHERLSFTGNLIFTTSSTQWRILSRLRATSRTRIAWIFDNVTVLSFLCPPLFTSRIPYAHFPKLQRIELDYRSRAANFRCRGTLQELRAGLLDIPMVDFARDTERFDNAIVEDAWRVGNDSMPRLELQQRVYSPMMTKETSKDPNRKIEVVVLKQMCIYDTSQPASGLPAWSGSHFSDQGQRTMRIWKVNVVATHRGRLEEVNFEIISADGRPVPLCNADKDVIWSLSEHGLGAFRVVVQKQVGSIYT